MHYKEIPNHSGRNPSPPFNGRSQAPIYGHQRQRKGSVPVGAHRNALAARRMRLDCKLLTRRSEALFQF